MTRNHGQFRLTTLLLAVACVAVNAWLFRLGALWGILGLNVTKHVVIAALCKTLGVDESASRSTPTPAAAAGPEVAARPAA
jgi:hypothetical protein